MLGSKNIRGASLGRLGRKGRLECSVWLSKQQGTKQIPSAVLTAAQLVPELLWDVSAEDLLVLTKFCRVERTGASAGWKWLWALCWLA